MGYPGAAVWRGLAGFHIVHDEEEDALPLPRGARDIPLMIPDRSFAADGSFQYPAIDGGGVADPYMTRPLPAVVLGNGAPWPALETDRVPCRASVPNASNPR